MSLHDKIMSLPCEQHNPNDAHGCGYIKGHRDARHAAAEIVLDADACIEALRNFLNTGFYGVPEKIRARAALQKLDKRMKVD